MKVRARVGGPLGAGSHSSESDEQQKLFPSPPSSPGGTAAAPAAWGRWKQALLILVLAGGLWLLASLPSSAPHVSKDSFVRVDGMQLERQCRPFYVAGFNVDNIAQAALAAVTRKLQGARAGTGGFNGRGAVRRLMQEAAAAGLNVMRTWAHTTDPDHPLQVRPGEYSEDAFQALDYIIAEAGRAGIKVVLSLVDNWKYPGGVDEFVDWSTTVPARDPKYPPVNKYGNASPKDFSLERQQYENRRKALFYSDPTCRTMYKAHVEAVLLRRNVHTGVLYRDDPAIMAFNLINEPRCSSYETPSCPAILSRWVEEMAAHIKSLDRNHLVTVGEEGFWGEKDGLHAFNPGFPSSDWAVKAGQDFVGDHSSPLIDFATVHLWPQNWEIRNTSFQRIWLEKHVEQAGAVVKKPLLIEEFGKAVGGDTRMPAPRAIAEVRDPVFALVQEVVEQAVSRGQVLMGSMYWRWGFSLYDNDLGPYGVVPGHSTFDLVAAHAQRIKRHMNSRPPRAECGLQCWVPKKSLFGIVRRCKNEPAFCSDLRANHKKLASGWGAHASSPAEVFPSQRECCLPGLGGFSKGCSSAWL